MNTNDTPENLHPLWLKNNTSIIMGSMLEFHRNVESCHDATSQQKRNLACTVYDNLKNIRTSDGTPLAFAPLGQDYDVIENMVARKMLPEAVMLQGAQESAVAYTPECRQVFGLNLTDQINYYVTLNDLADSYSLDVNLCILNNLDRLFGFERNADGSFFSRISDYHGEAMQIHIFMNLPASILCKNGVHMRRSAEALNLTMGNWFAGCSQSGFAVLSGYTQAGETCQSLLERIRKAAAMYQDVENDCRNLFKSNPSSLSTLIRNLLSSIDSTQWVSENQMMMWLSVLWLAQNIGMMPELTLQPMTTRMMELTDLSLRQYVERYAKLTDDLGVLRAHALKKLVNECRYYNNSDDLPF